MNWLMHLITLKPYFVSPVDLHDALEPSHDSEGFFPTHNPHLCSIKVQKPCIQLQVFLSLMSLFT